MEAGKKRRKLLEKYGDREKNRLNDLYHKLASRIVELAGNHGIVLEDLRDIRDSIKYSAEMNGRLQAKLKGVNIVFLLNLLTPSPGVQCVGVS